MTSLPQNILPLVNGVLPSNNYTSGLTNKSRICYLNSVLQCLLHTKGLYNYCILSYHSKFCKRKESKCIFCVFEKEVYANNGTVRSCDIAFSKFKNCFSDTSKENDAHEYMLFLLNEMIGSENLYRINFASMLFQGKLRSKISSSCCHNSATIETFIFLSLVHFKTLEECIDKFFLQEMIEPRGSYFCSACSKSSDDACKKFSLEEVPIIICIQLKLFKSTGGKIIKDIQWAEYIQLGKYTSIYDDYKEQIDIRYHLFAMVAHYGAEEKTGHYKTFVNNGGWLTLNDDQIINGLILGDGTPYLLFFERVGYKEDESLIMEDIHDLVGSVEMEYKRITALCMEWLKQNQGYISLKTNIPIEMERTCTDLIK